MARNKNSKIKTKREIKGQSSMYALNVSLCNRYDTSLS